MTTASEEGKDTRCMCRSRPPKMQLGMLRSFHGLCLWGHTMAHLLLGYEPGTIQHFKYASRMIVFMFNTMRKKAPGYLSPVFEIICRLHGDDFSASYGDLIFGLFNVHQSPCGRSMLMYWAIKAFMKEQELKEQSVTPTEGLEDAIEGADSGNVDLCCDAVCAVNSHGFSVFDVAEQVHGGASDSEQNLKSASLIADFMYENMRDEEQRRGKKRRNPVATEIRPRKRRKLNVSKKSISVLVVSITTPMSTKLTTQQVLKAIAMTGDDSTKRTIAKYIVKTYNVDNNETLKNHVIQVVNKGLKTNLIKKGSTSYRFSLI